MIKLFLICVIACAPSVVFASSPALPFTIVQDTLRLGEVGSSSSSSASFHPQSLTQQLIQELNKPKPNLVQAERLIRAGANVNIIINDKGTTPLMYAVKFESDLRYAIIRAGANMYMRDRDDKTAADYAQYWPRRHLYEIEMVHEFSQRAHDPALLKSFCQHVDWSKRDVYFDSNQINNTRVQPINYRLGRVGETALMIAAFLNRVEDLTLLLNAHADVNIGCDVKSTALHYAACDEQNIVSMQLLIDSGAKINVRDRWTLTPFQETGYKENLSGMNVLVTNGVSYNWQDVAYGLCRSSSLNSMIYYLMATKPMRSKYKTDQDFQHAIDAWNMQMQDEKIRRGNGDARYAINNADTIADSLTPDQIKQCDDALTQRNKLLTGGNLLQLLRQRETTSFNSPLLRRRLMHRMSVLEEPAAELGDVVTQQTASASSSIKG